MLRQIDEGFLLDRGRHIVQDFLVWDLGFRFRNLRFRVSVSGSETIALRRQRFEEQSAPSCEVRL